MPDTLGTTNGALIARRILETLLAEFPMLRMFTADFSPEGSLYGQAIKIHLPSGLTADDYDETNGYTAQNVTQTDVPLTINKFKHVTYGFNDVERSSTSIDLVERFARNGAHALGAAMMGDLFALLTETNFTNESVSNAASFNRAKIVALGRKLSGATRRVPKIGRFLIVNSAYYETLANDTVLVANPGSPSDTVRSGSLGNVHGFKVEEYPELPANTHDLYGFAGVAEGLCIATRVPQIPANMGEVPGTIMTVTEPNTLLSLQVRTWYDMQKGKEFRCYTIMYGVAVGDPKRIERLVAT